MVNLEQYIYEEVLSDKLKLNALSNRLGKITLQLINNANKLGLDILSSNLGELKKLRVKLLETEKTYYSQEIPLKGLRKVMVSQYKEILTVYKDLAESLKNAGLANSDKEKMDRALIKLKEFLIDLKKTIEIM